MLFAPTAAKHDLVSSNAVGGLKKSNCSEAAVLNNGLRRFNQQQTQHQHRQHHNHQEQQQRDQQQQQQQSQDDLKVKSKQQNHHNQQKQQLKDLYQNHVLNSAKKEHHQQQQYQYQKQQQQQTHHHHHQQQQQQQQQQQLTMEAMSKIDATMVAYLAGEIQEQKIEQKSTDVELCTIDRPLKDAMFEKLEIFKRISGIKLHMEALTLQPEGTKRMELLQNDIRPIFTVECQLSHELIKAVSRYDMFHIMQFESEKFHSLTQCTRFGQEAERAVKLSLTDDAENNNDDKPNFGQIHFIVWWREPGTCLNEMLGTGVLALDELYTASVLEQCKNIVIQRRKKHLANLYFKISLQIESATEATIVPASIENTSSDNTVDKVNLSTAELNSKDTAQKSGKSERSSNVNNSDGNDNNVQIETTHFIAETSRVRLLRGFIYASEVRQLNLYEDSDYLVCRRFWENELAVTTAGVDNKFNYQEQFAVLNDDAFLQRVERQYLQLEIWRRQSTVDSTDRNENIEDIRPLGIARLPLHQFFIAYRDMAITNHLCKGKLPVVSFDAWAPIISYNEMGRPIGELRCVLAIGSDEQIANLKEIQGYSDEFGDSRQVEVDKKLFLQRPFTPMAAGSTSSGIAPQPSQQRSTANLLEFLQRSLTAQPPIAAPPPPRMPPEASQAAATAASTTVAASSVSPSLLKPLQMPNVKSFRFLLEIQRANGLPRNPGARGKKSSKRNIANKQQRFPPNEAPSTYVTFQADEGFGPVYKSHEGAVYATNIVEKSTQPQWQQRFRISASVEYLLNSQKRFILKVWKKAATDSSQKRQQPTPLEDAIVGFAALDLNVFMRGHYLAGCFNIVDFNGRINGQLEVRSQPLEDLHQLLSVNRGAMVLPRHHQPPTASTTLSSHASLDSFIDEFDNALGLAHLNLGQAIKRKFNELESISQRLRTRLVDVTGEQLAPEFNVSLLDDWQADKDKNITTTGDDFDEFDEFQHDINTAPETPPPTSSTSLLSSPLQADGIDDNEAAQNYKAQFKIASIASASVNIERKDASKSMTPKE